MAVSNSTAVNISWFTPSNGSCIDHYTASVNGSTVRNLTTESNSIVVDELEQGRSYSFSVRAVDLIGRKGAVSETITLTMDGMENMFNKHFMIPVDYCYYTMFVETMLTNVIIVSLMISVAKH